MNGSDALLRRLALLNHGHGFVDSPHMFYAGVGIHDEAKYERHPFEECPDALCVEVRAALDATRPVEVNGSDALLREAFQKVRRQYVGLPEEGADSVDAAIAEALNAAEEAVRAALDATNEPKVPSGSDPYVYEVPSSLRRAALDATPADPSGVGPVNEATVRAALDATPTCICGVTLRPSLPGQWHGPGCPLFISALDATKPEPLHAALERIRDYPMEGDPAARAFQMRIIAEQALGHE